jgi:hypothetical protein
MTGRTQSYSQALWYTPVISALGRLRQEDSKLEASLGYIERLSQKKKRREEGKQSHNIKSPQNVRFFIITLLNLVATL